VKLLSQLFDSAGSTNIGEDCVKSDGTMDATWLNRPVSVAWPNRLANTYKEPTSTFSGYEESEIEVGEGLEEPSSDVRSEVRSGVNSEETNEKYGDCAPAKSHREEVLYNPIQTAPLQTEFQSSQRCGKPVRLSVRPSRFRYEAFETQFQPRRKKKLRRVCLHPGKGESSGFSSVDGDCDLTQKQRKEQKYFRFGRGDQKAVKQGASKQIGRTSSSLNNSCSCNDGCFSGRCPKLSRRTGPKFGRPIWSKTRFKRSQWSWWKFQEEGEKERIALNHQYLYQIENLDTWSAEFRQVMHGMQPTWPHYRCRSEENEDRRQEGCNNSGLLSDQKGRAFIRYCLNPFLPTDGELWLTDC